MHVDESKTGKSPYAYKRFPACLYKKDGSTKVVATPDEERAALAEGWVKKAILPPDQPPTAAPETIEGRVAHLEEQMRTVLQQIATPGLPEPPAPGLPEPPAPISGSTAPSKKK